jgi:hypothetical protein
VTWRCTRFTELSTPRSPRAIKTNDNLTCSQRHHVQKASKGRVYRNRKLSSSVSTSSRKIPPCSQRQKLTFPTGHGQQGLAALPDHRHHQHHPRWQDSHPSRSHHPRGSPPDVPALEPEREAGQSRRGCDRPVLFLQSGL